MSFLSESFRPETKLGSEFESFRLSASCGGKGVPPLKTYSRTELFWVRRQTFLRENTKLMSGSARNKFGPFFYSGGTSPLCPPSNE